jgi:hypothetical protein
MRMKGVYAGDEQLCGKWKKKEQPTKITGNKRCCRGIEREESVAQPIRRLG